MKKKINHFSPYVILFSVILSFSFNTFGKIAIIGAGPSGLSAAKELLERGYDDITIFESSKVPGGKVSSIEKEDKVYEMGAVVVFKSWKLIIDLAKEYDVPLKKAPVVSYRLDDKGIDQPFKVGGAWNLMKLGLAARKYRALMKRYENFFIHGFHEAPEELKQPFGKWIKENNLEPIKRIYQLFVTGCGYGPNIDEVPAMYVIKLMDWPAVLSFLKNGSGLFKYEVFSFVNGYQDLWEKVAKGMEEKVKYEKRVKRISKNDEGKVILEIAGEKPEVFDQVIVTAPFDVTRELLDEHTYPDLVEAARKVRFHDYYTSLWKGHLNPALKEIKPTAFFTGNYGGDKPGSVVLDINFHPGQRVSSSCYHVAYQFKGDGQDNEALADCLERDIKSRGGSFEELERQKSWPNYFPHVSLEDFDVYHVLEAQNKNGNLMITGGVLGFETVYHAAKHGKELVQKRFPNKKNVIEHH